MRPLYATDYTVQHGEITFAFRQLSTVQALLVEELLFGPLRPTLAEGKAPALTTMAQIYAVLIALSWDPASPLGPLDTPIPSTTEWTAETLQALGDQVIQELDAAGMQFADIQPLGLAIRNRMHRRPALGEADDHADFSGARRGEAPSSLPTSG